MIVKIQISQFSSDSQTRTLIYNEKRDVYHETAAPGPIVAVKKLLGNRPKAYFDVTVTNKEIDLTSAKEVPAQDW